MNAAITPTITAAGACRFAMIARATTGGSDPHVPGAIGNHPNPKHDAISLFIVQEP
jgi:hypothetical protein